MAQQEHAKTYVRPTPDAATRTAADDDVDQAVADAAARAAEDETLATTDALLDEIDAILIEEEDFAIHYVQKGGQ